MEVLCFLPTTHYPLYDFDLRATHARTLLPAALASVSFGFVLVRVLSAVSQKSEVSSQADVICKDANNLNALSLRSQLSCPLLQLTFIGLDLNSLCSNQGTYLANENEELL